MRNPLRSRFGPILLVLVLGFICSTSLIKPIQSFNFDEVSASSQSVSEQDNQKDQELAPVDDLQDSSSQQSAASDSTNINEEIEDAVINEPGDKQSSSPVEKRGMGMPSTSAARELSLIAPDNEKNADSPRISDPINDPINDPTSDPKSQEPAAPKQSEILAPSTARGLGGSGQVSGSQQGQTAVRKEDLPTIIEKNSPVYSDSSKSQSNQQQHWQQQQQQQQQEQQQQEQQQSGAVATGLVQGASGQQQQMSMGDSNLPMSSARTFDSWTNCVGAQSSKYGTCKNDVECGKSKGRADGSCMGGLGVCCVVALSCGDKSFENNTFFANADFPEPSWEARLCEVELKKKHSKILQIMIEFEDFELAPPNHEGECITDVFQVKLASNRPSPYSLLRICGQNAGQHLYLDVSQIDEPLVLSVATSGGGFPRRWSIRIVQMDEKNFLLAPPGCLQYYTDTVGHFRSFNLGRNLKNLYYAICFRIDNGYSGIRFTENFFGMNGPFCRKRIGGGPGGYSGGLVGGRFNSSFAAHPHHLVIPPPGYASPLPRPNQKFPLDGPHHKVPVGQFPPQFGLPPQQTPVLTRYKRLAYAEPELAARQTRTLPNEHEREHSRHTSFEHDKHEFKHHHEDPHSHHHSPPPAPHGGGYGGYGPPVQSYGQPGYEQYGSYKQHEKFEFKDKVAHEADSKGWAWKDRFGDTFGWVGARKEDTFDKFDKTPNHYGYAHQGYGGKQQYGHHGYGGAGYGEYHHKEIDKFGKQYEHLEYKHEKNHLGKEKVDSNKSSWWPSWGKKEDKKLEKFQQHHEALFPMMRIPEMPHCEPRFCGANDVITFPPSGDSIAEMCGNRFNRGRGPKIISGSPLVVYVSNRGHTRGSGFDMNYEQIFYIPKPY